MVKDCGILVLVLGGGGMIILDPWEDSGVRFVFMRRTQWPEGLGPFVGIVGYREP